MSSPFPMFADQVPRKDGDFDGNVIDSYDIETDAPPTPIIEPIPVLARPPRLFPTRLFTGYQRFGQNSVVDGTMILPPDVRRVDLKIRVVSLNATPDIQQYVLIAGDKQNLSLGAVNFGGSVFICRSGVILSMDSHTGAVWIAPNTPSLLAAEGIEVSWAVTTLQPNNGNDTELQ